MCGIIGYTGSEDVKGVLLDALELLEYRGYDSAGIAVADTGLKQTKVYKCAGRVKDLRAICESEKLITECGIGHTRWACLLYTSTCHDAFIILEHLCGSGRDHYLYGDPWNFMA